MEAIVARLAGERGLSPEHAEQWLLFVGLESPIAEIQGDRETVAAARRAIEEGAAGLVDELRLSLDYYRALENAVPVSRVVLCGTGSAIRAGPRTWSTSCGGTASRSTTRPIPCAAATW